MPWICLFLLLWGCNEAFYTQSHSSYNWQVINSRDEGQPSERAPLYRVKVPSYWTRQDPLHTDSIADTTKPICEFYIEDEESIHITVHNFPEQRIPPIAQVSRWRQQLEDLDLLQTSVETVSHGGFVGLFLTAEGNLKGKLTKVLGWSMQLALEFYQQLENTQKRADYTIKVLGSPALVNKHQEEIALFANSFELIDELPSP